MDERPVSQGHICVAPSGFGRWLQHVGTDEDDGQRSQHVNPIRGWPLLMGAFSCPLREANRANPEFVRCPTLPLLPPISRNLSTLLPNSARQAVPAAPVAMS